MSSPPSAALDFGVRSYCFRECKDNRTVARLVRETGLDKIEVCAVHGNFNDLSALVRELEDGGFDGMAVLEYEADPSDPVPALKRCVERMRGLARRGYS